ncbi:polysaccharide biosynthesis tyrosine autokinase [Paraburkholderia metrosideri]|uniref:Tyrosine-protein kinase in cps region n=1 Tax=Paraburkholderia metrosideri TaxID=580937 RepID=A0ABN7HKY6_9BURK|nr:polysaccharide biosynthesis tyrosine autokinase [Paraburkholderia metrosideri]CAD6524764.1 Putative tyrosine-protein kinase in cps region [Paraburkholderia metrosideri]
MKRTPQTIASYASDGYELRSIVATLINRRVMILSTALVFVLLGTAYAFFSAPIYQAGILIRVEDSNEPASATSKDVLRNASPTFDVKSSAEGEMQILGSKLIVSRAVDALKLYITATPRYFPIIGSWIARHSDILRRPGLYGMAGFAWGGESIKVANFEVPERAEGRSYRLIAQAGGRYQLTGPGLQRPVIGRVGVSERFLTNDGFVTLLVEQMIGESDVAFDLTRHSRQITIDDLRKTLRISESGVKSNVLGATLQGTDPVRLSATINQIGNEYVRQNADRKAVIAEKTLTFLQAQLPAMKAQVQDAEEKYNAYRNTHVLIDPSEEGRQLLRQSADAAAQIVELKRRREELASRFSYPHPSVVASDQQIASTEQYLDDVNARMKALPLTEQGALRLQRDLQVSTELYSAMLNNIEQLQIIRAGKVGSVLLIDSADVPELPVKPIKSLVLLVSALVGLALGSAVALARDLMFRGVTDPQELEAVTGLSVFATIPQSQRQVEMTKKAPAGSRVGLLLAALYPEDPAVEGLRMLRSALQFAMSGARNNVILLAGPLPGIGKSFTSANLAAVLAAGGKRVLLVDGDLRRGQLNEYFSLARTEGLKEALDGSAALDAVIQKDVLPNLDFIETGEYPSDPAELLLRSGVSEVIQEVARRYDIVLLDAPAILVVSDTGTMAPAAGLIFLMARFGETRMKEIVESSKRLAQTGARVNGLLLNGFKGPGGSYGDAKVYGGQAYVAHRYEATGKRSGTT